ncbi:MAG TPA: hypothetical protein VIU64_19535 [Polyangia bacterium]
MNDDLRVLASYRIDFDGVASLPREAIATRIVDVLSEFQGVQELRVIAGGALSAYVSIPYDVDPEILDSKARALRLRWDSLDDAPPGTSPLARALEVWGPEGERVGGGT